MTRYLTLDEAVYVAERLGLHLRDAGLLASAIARPAASFGGEEVYPAPAAKAAVLLESLARNHPLFDGNKRTAWVLTQQFLWINGQVLEASEDDAFALVIGVASGATPAEESTRWIERRLRSR